METAARIASVPDQISKITAAATKPQIATTGVPCRASISATRSGHGVPLSRAKENKARELLVSTERPQNHIATPAIADSELPMRSPSAFCRIDTAVCPGDKSRTAKVSAISMR